MCIILILVSISCNIFLNFSECGCEEALGSTTRPLIPPLPGEGALVASEKRMVVMRDVPTDLPLKINHSSSASGSDDSSLHCKLSSIDSDDDISSPCSPNETKGELDMSISYEQDTGVLKIQLLQVTRKVDFFFLLCL